MGVDYLMYKMNNYSIYQSKIDLYVSCIAAFTVRGLGYKREITEIAYITGYILQL